MMSKEKKEKPIDPEALVDEALEETFPARASDPASRSWNPATRPRNRNHMERRSKTAWFT
jgi:hypothetical protein